MENRSRLLVDACVTRVSGHAERVAALAMIAARADRPCSITFAERSFDDADVVNERRSMNMRPHVVRNVTRRNGRSAIDGRTTRHAGYAASPRIRKRIEESVGRVKSIAGPDRPMVRVNDRGEWAFAAAVYSLVRLPKLVAGAA